MGMASYSPGVVMMVAIEAGMNIFGYLVECQKAGGTKKYYSIFRYFK
jgi:hypothetical protein